MGSISACPVSSERPGGRGVFGPFQAKFEFLLLIGLLTAWGVLAPRILRIMRLVFALGILFAPYGPLLLLHIASATNRSVISDDIDSTLSSASAVYREGTWPSTVSRRLEGITAYGALGFVSVLLSTRVRQQDMLFSSWNSLCFGHVVRASMKTNGVLSCTLATATVLPAGGLPDALDASFVAVPGGGLDVRGVGAMGDGFTDDTAAITDALRAGAGGVVWFPPSRGCYMVTTIRPRSGTILTGGGCIDILDDGTATGGSIYLSDVSNVTIRGLTIQSSNARSRSGVYGNIRIAGSRHIKILGNLVRKSSSVGIWAATTDGLLIRGNKISGTYADGIQISRACQHVRVIENEISFTGDDGIGIVGYVDGSKSYSAIADVTIAQNHIHDVTTSVGRGISLYGVEKVTVTGNKITNIYDAGILVGAIAGTGATATRYSTGITITGNRIRATGVGPGAANSGIYISYVRRATIALNTIDSTSANGIDLAGVVKDIRVKSNVISNWARSEINQAGEVTSTDPRLIREMFTNSGEAGVRVAASGNIWIGAAKRRLH